jgi:hypothetical protein
MKAFTDNFNIVFDENNGNAPKFVRQTISQPEHHRLNLYEVYFVVSNEDKIVNDDWLYILAENEETALEHAKLLVANNKDFSLFTATYEVEKVPFYMTGWGGTKF